MQASFAALLSLALPSAVCGAPIGIVALVLEGDPVPGVPGETFESFGEVEISQTGRVAFWGHDTARRGIWAIDDRGAPATLLRSGDSVPDVPGATAGFPYGPFPLASGRVAFATEISSGGLGLFVWDPVAGSTLVARSGEEVAGTGGARLFEPRYGGLTSSGLALTGRLVGGDATDASDEVAVHVGASGLSTLLREGASEPGVAGRSAALPGVFAPDDRSERMFVTGNGTLYQSNELGALELVADFAATPPGFAGGTLVEAAVGPLFSVGPIGFGGRVSGQLRSADEGVWISDGEGPLALAVREGDALAGGLSAAGLVRARPVFDAAGRFAFEADTVGVGADARSSILLHDSATGLALVARSGDSVPGIVGYTFASGLGQPQLNARGDLVFWAAITPSGGAPVQAIFVLRAGGALELLLREGDTLEVAPGDLRTVSQLSAPLSCVVPCDRRILGDDGHLVFRAIFSDEREGLFVATLPEPRIVWLALLALAALALRMPRQQPEPRRDR